MAVATNMHDFMEGVARRMNVKPPPGYGYEMDVELGVGFYREQRSGVKLLEKPIILPTGKAPGVGDALIFFAYSSKEGVEALITSGATPPKLPATQKEPKDFASLEAIADNFGAKDVSKAKNEYCVAVRVDGALANKVDTPGRDIWIVSLDQDKITPMIDAASSGDTAKVSKILAEGVSSEIYDEDGVSLLMIASVSGSAPTVDVLLKANANPNYATANGRTALMCAAQGGHTAILDLLVKSSADVNKVDDEGSTALIWAAIAGRVDATRFLAGFGNKGVKNKQGLTALELAQHHPAVVDILK